MSGWDREMQKALEADGEKLRQMTGEDHGPIFVTDQPTPDPFSTWLNNFANDLRGKPKEEPEVQDKEDEEQTMPLPRQRSVEE